MQLVSACGILQGWALCSSILCLQVCPQVGVVGRLETKQIEFKLV